MDRPPSLSASIIPPGADDSSAGAGTTSPARPVIGDAGWLHSLSESSWSQDFPVVDVAFSWGAPPTPTSAAGSVDGSGTSAAGTVDGVAHAQGQEGPLFTFVLALLAYCAGAMAGVLADSKDTIGKWKTVPRVLYGVTAVLAIASLAIGFMAAGCHAAVLATVVAAAGSSGNLNLRVSAFCARLGAILSSVLLVVAICCKLGRWGCATGVPSAAVVATIMAVVWICGDERAAARAVRHCWRRIKELCLTRTTTPSTSTADLELAAGGGGGDDIV